MGLRTNVARIHRAAELGLVVPASAAAFVTFYAVAIVGELVPVLGASVFLVVYACYRYDASTDIGRHDGPTRSSRTRALELDGAGRARSAAAGVAGLALAWQGGGALAALLMLAFPAMVFLYSVGVGNAKDARRGARRLKDIAGCKGIYVAAGWALLIVWARLFLGDAPPDSALAMATWLGLAAFVNTVGCDFKDLERDRVDGTATLPRLLGVRPTLTLLHAVNAAAACLAIAAIAVGVLPALSCGLVAANLVLAAALHRLAAKPDDADFLSNVVLDSFGVTLVPFIGIACLCA
jgi:4-hydroxybenzoate polyprenyltransferase